MNENDVHVIHKIVEFYTLFFNIYNGNHHAHIAHLIVCNNHVLHNMQTMSYNSKVRVHTFFWTIIRKKVASTNGNQIRISLCTRSYNLSSFLFSPDVFKEMISDWFLKYQSPSAMHLVFRSPIVLIYDPENFQVIY